MHISRNLQYFAILGVASLGSYIGFLVFLRGWWGGSRSFSFQNMIGCACLSISAYFSEYGWFQGWTSVKQGTTPAISRPWEVVLPGFVLPQYCFHHLFSSCLNDPLSKIRGVIKPPPRATDSSSAYNKWKLSQHRLETWFGCKRF